MSNPHEGHRGRLRELLRDNASAVDAHQLLEALLFYSVPRCDTNEMAHALLAHFGSLEAVLSASVEELMKVGEIGQSSADLVHLIGSIWHRLGQPGNDARRPLDSVARITSYLARLFAGAVQERAYMLLLDSSLRLLDCVPVCHGSVSSAAVKPGQLVKRALTAHAAAVVLAHNHPNGIAVPSRDDIDTTELLRAALELVNVRLLEHIVVSGSNYSTIMRQRNLALLDAEPGGLGGSLTVALPKHFYDEPVIITTDLPQPRRDGLDVL